MAAMQDRVGAELTEGGEGAEALNEYRQEYWEMCQLKLVVVSTITADFRASEAQILNKLREVEINKSPMPCATLRL